MPYTNEPPRQPSNSLKQQQQQQKKKQQLYRSYHENSYIFFYNYEYNSKNILKKKIFKIPNLSSLFV